MITACLLGDGILSKAGKNYRLMVEHTLKDEEYVHWKFQFLKRLSVSDVQYVPSHDSYRFGTVGHPEITEMRQAWYRPTKQVPSKLVLTPLMLAIWFMDDGTKHRDTVDISVHNFSKESLDILRNRVSLFGIQTTVNSDSKGSRLYVLKKSYPRFESLAKPYMVQCMERKLP